MRDWNSTAAERAAAYPCDALLPQARLQLFRAITVAAPEPIIFRWLCQLKVAPYSYDWLDNWGRRSPRRLTEGADRLEVGQRVMTIFTLTAFEPNSHLTMVLTRSRNLFGTLALTYQVWPQRIVVKLCWSPPWLWLAPLFAFGDWIMMRKQLLTLKTLAEGGGQGGEKGSA